MTKVKAALHEHLRTSSKWADGDFNTAIDTARIRLGYNGVVGLVNYDDSRYEAFSDLPGYDRVSVGKGNAFYVPQKSILVIKGQEVPTKEGHLLVLGLPKGKHLKSGRPLEETLIEAKDNHAVTIADHPFHAYGIGPKLERDHSLLALLDAIEIFNGEASLGVPILNWPFPFRANKKAERYYEKALEGLPTRRGTISASDGHSFYELGQSWTKIDFPDIKQSEEAFLRTLNDSVRFATAISPDPYRKDRQNDKEKQKNRLLGSVGAVDHFIDVRALILKEAFRNLISRI